MEPTTKNIIMIFLFLLSFILIFGIKVGLGLMILLGVLYFKYKKKTDKYPWEGE